MFRDGAGVAGAVNIKATLSVLCNNDVIPSPIWRVDRDLGALLHRDLMRSPL